MNFLTPAAFLAGLIAIPIILLYMLRLRRREIVISSTFLWSQVLQDQEANTPWQRLRRNLLLFLQLLILLLLVFTLARPYMTVPAVSARQTVLLLDASASMNATDTGESRFREAQRHALQVIDTLSAGSAMTIIRVAEVAEVLAPYTVERDRLRDAINNARPGYGQAAWDAALNLAVAGRTAGEDFSIVIISDGGLGETAGLPGIESDLRYIPVGQSGDNLAISALATRALPGQPPQLFSQITNYGTTAAEVVFSLRVDGRLVTSELYSVPAGGTLPVVSTAALGGNFTTLEAGLTLSVNTAARDYLEVDNTAYAVASQISERRALVMTSGNLYLEQVLRSLPGLQSFRGNIEVGLPQQAYDLYIFDGWLPPVLPQADMLIINPPASTPFFILGDENQQTTNPSSSADPRTAFVDVRDMSLLRFRNVSGVDWATPLITVDGGPLLLAGERGSQQVALMPFDLRESDLVLQIAWPVLISNLVEWFTPQDTLTGTSSLAVGESLVIRPPLDAGSVRVTLPDGEARILPVDRETLIFTGTARPGIYMLEALDGTRVIRRQPVAVNLFSPLESRIAPVAEGQLRVGDVTVAVVEEEALGQRELWPIVAGLALAFLMLEWYAYHRRLRPVTAHTAQRPTSPRPGLRRELTRLLRGS